MSKNLVVRVGAFALILGACGGAEPDRSRTIEPKTETVKSDNQEAAPKNIESALLTLEEMPFGWSVEPPSEENNSSTDFCGKKLPSKSGEVDKANVSFAKGIGVPTLEHSVLRLKSGQGALLMNRFLNLFEDCRSFKQDGQTIEVQPLSFKQVGDESISARFVATNELGLTAAGDMVLWSRDDLVTYVLYISFSPSQVILDMFVDKADRKLVALLEGE